MLVVLFCWKDGRPAGLCSAAVLPAAASPTLLPAHITRYRHTTPPPTLTQVCDVCPPGTYQDKPGQLTCLECPVGTYSEMTGARAVTDCKPAPAGNFAEGTGNDGFTPCLAGTFQDKPGQGTCKVRAGWGAASTQ